MNISPLQKARYEYTPKLPGMLRNGIADICVNEGAETQSVADQEKIKALFPNTYGKKEITFQKGQNTSEAKKQVVGPSFGFSTIILSEFILPQPSQVSINTGFFYCPKT